MAKRALEDICKAKIARMRPVSSFDYKHLVAPYLQQIDENVAKMLRIDIDMLSYITEFFYSYGGR
jgi:hypothetical protein